MNDNPAWAKGFPLDFLREIAALFKAEHGPHSHGAFGLPKENAIADAHAKGGLIWTKAKHVAGEPIAAAALFRSLASASSHEDFAGRAAKPQAADLMIRAIAGSEDGKRRILGRLIDAARPAIWVEGHVENRELCALLEELDFRRIITKVMGSSDLKGLWLRDRSRKEPALRLPPAPSPADAPALAILEPDFISAEECAAVLCEAEEFSASVGGAWADHYSTYNKRRSWSAFALRGFDAFDFGFIEKPAEMSRAWRDANPDKLAWACQDTPAADHFPAAMAIAARIPGEKQRIRLMRLAPNGGELTRHADIIDPEAGTADGKVARLHIPLVTSLACAFQGWGMDGSIAEAHFPARALCYLDTRKPHAARNAGDCERIHLVIDTFASDPLREMIASRAEPERMRVKVSAKMARLLFTQCGPDCIAAHGCHGNCCYSSSAPSGVMIAISEFERERIEALGGKVEAGLLQPRPGERRCLFISSEGLCSLHDSGAKPFGCTASPFTLNGSGTLIIRNRYRLLPCFKPGGPKAPAYQAFASSLLEIFGAEEGQRIIRHLDEGGGDIQAWMPGRNFAAMRGNDAARKRAKAGA